MNPTTASTIALRAAERAFRPRRISPSPSGRTRTAFWPEKEAPNPANGNPRAPLFARDHGPPQRRLAHQHHPVHEVQSVRRYRNRKQLARLRHGPRQRSLRRHHAHRKSLGDWMSQKFDPMSTITPAVANVLKGRSNKSSDNNAARKRFTGGILYTKTAGSTAELKAPRCATQLPMRWTNTIGKTSRGPSRPARSAPDRVSRFKAFRPVVAYDHGRQPDRAALPRRRPAPVSRALPTLRRTPVAQMGQFTLDPTPQNDKLVSAVWYVCEHCGSEIQEQHKSIMLPEIGHGGRARWIPEIETPTRIHPGISTPSICPWAWEILETARRAMACRAGQPEKLMVFVNTRLGETYSNRTKEVKAKRFEIPCRAPTRCAPSRQEPSS